jgi:NAD(P)-dependent dehydrogenase (short-subunit alcohol dehydrogenase family)
MIVTGLSGKVVVVTGGASGIGRATAIRFGEEGCRVAVWDRIAVDEDLAREISAHGGECLCAEVDVTEASAVRAAVTSVIQRWSRLDVLINNAGLTHDALLVKWKGGDRREPPRCVRVYARSGSTYDCRRRWRCAERVEHRRCVR